MKPSSSISPKVSYVDMKLTIAREFNELVNMTAGELEDWLKQEASQSSGWGKGDGSGESVGHER